MPYQDLWSGFFCHYRQNELGRLTIIDYLCTVKRHDHKKHPETWLAKKTYIISIMLFKLRNHNRQQSFAFILSALFALNGLTGWAQPATGTKVREIDNSPAKMENGGLEETRKTSYKARKQISDYKSEINGDVETITINGVSFNMVKVKGGTFTMGATEEQGDDAYATERPAHKVTLTDFMIGETEVTQQLWEAIMGKNPSPYQGANFPVQCVRYVDCETFFFKLNFLTNRNFRLPTEAEWEFAARGGTKAIPTKYAGGDNFDEVAWYCNNSGNQPHNVKEKAPNELGLYDMSGNVDEWVVDAWSDYTETTKDNPKVINNSGEKVRRGGGFLDFQRHLRVSDRRGCSEYMWNFDIGLRLAE